MKYDCSISNILGELHPKSTKHDLQDLSRILCDTHIHFFFYNTHNPNSADKEIQIKNERCRVHYRQKIVQKKSLQNKLHIESFIITLL